MRLFYKILTLAMLLTFTPLSAMAQSTPQGYCANVSGCEILGWKLGGVNSNGYTSMVVEYCRANKYSFSLVGAYPPQSGSTGYYYFPVVYNNGQPYGVAGTTALTSASLCALQYYDSTNGINRNVLQ